MNKRPIYPVIAGWFAAMICLFFAGTNLAVSLIAGFAVSLPLTYWEFHKKKNESGNEGQLSED